ncbi:hypothetical protein BDV12DRAFT_179441 [Aspergillus spectabilis]
MNLDWLQPVKGPRGTLLLHGRCLTSIREQLISPQTQSPGLVLLLGCRQKDEALRHIFSAKKSPTREKGVRLHLDGNTGFGDHPVLVADCDPHLTPGMTESWKPDYEEVPFDQEDQHMLDTILARLLFLFVDVICIFAEDMGGLDAVHASLRRWIALGQNASCLDYKPRVLIICGSDMSSVTSEILEERDFLFHMTRYPEAPDVFASINLFRLPKATSMSNMARYRPLKEEIMKALDLSRRLRKEEGYLLSGAHLEVYFHSALWHLSQTPSLPFDFVQSARVGLLTHEDHTTHLRSFLELTSSSPWEDQASFIASTLLLDGYSPGTHFFKPASVFASLYKAPCQAALKGVGMTSGLSQTILNHLTRLYIRLSLGQGPSRRIHKENLGQWHGLTASIISTQTCLICLVRSPQHSLPCRHTYCDKCAAVYGHASEGGEYKFHIKRCALCDKPCNVVVNVLPPTAGIRAVSINGGGVRGFIPLRFLTHFQLLLGAECQVQDLVDVAFGTSSGGLLALKLFHQRLTVEESERAFTDLMMRFVDMQPQPRSPWQKVMRILRCWWTDGWYDPSIWNVLLQRQFGRSELIFGTQRVSGAKVAVVTVVDSQTVLLINYRRFYRDLGEGSFYRVHDSDQDLELWKCARATTAVPGLFPPIDLPGIGYCEDGGLKHNSPALLCRSETQLMWPSKLEPTALVSLGTGSGPTGRGKGPIHFRVSKRGFVSRLYDSLMAADGNESWGRFISSLDKEKSQNYHHLDVTFSGKLPRLNSTDEVKQMVSLVDRLARVQVLPALTSLILSSFFLELSTPPRLDFQHLYCVGAIRCRLGGKAVVNILKRLYPLASSYYFNNKTLSVSPYEKAICEDCGRYCVPLRFHVTTIDSPITLTIQLESGLIRQIGCFTRPLRWFVEQQGFSVSGNIRFDPFPARVECESCDRKIYRKKTLVGPYDNHRKRVQFI